MSEAHQKIDPLAQTLLLEEYKIIQGKIDKIGEDKFKVRSWSFTLLTGGIAITKFSGASDSDLPIGPWTFLLFLPAIAAFHLVECRQRQIGKRLGLRAEAIESLWRRLFKTDSREKVTPQLASYLIREARAEKAIFSYHLWFERVFYPERAAERLIRFRAAPSRQTGTVLASIKAFLISNADDAFYWAEYALVLIFIGILICGLQKPQPASLSDRGRAVGVDSQSRMNSTTNLGLPAETDLRTNSNAGKRTAK
ncbi:MAG TPA: hypothetical protein VGY56_20345 [Verrucomicrobiae bacterium]|nr:hypothetical protein [Verrucomicrobiae bacterium]